MKGLIIKYVLSRLREASTWRGIILLVSGGWAIKHPDQVEAIIPVAISIVGMIGAFLPDGNQKPHTNEVTQESGNIESSEEEDNKHAETGFNNR